MNCQNCHNPLTSSRIKFCCRACAAAYTSRFHNTGIFIKDEQEWLYHLKHYSDDYIQNYTYEFPTNLSSLNNYFSGYYMDIHHEVRSGSEHNLCRILQLLHVDYDYEMYSFKLNNHLTYKPDFYLPSENTFYEMKGEWRGDSQEKVNLFNRVYPSIKLIIIDMKTYINIEKYVSVLFNINFNNHIRITKQLVRHIPQFRYQNISYDDNELKYQLYTNKILFTDLIEPITVSDTLNKLLQPYRNNGQIYYAIYNNQYYYNRDTIKQFKNKLKAKTKIITPNLIQKELF